MCGWLKLIKKVGVWLKNVAKLIPKLSVANLESGFHLL